MKALNQSAWSSDWLIYDTRTVMLLKERKTFQKYTAFGTCFTLRKIGGLDFSDFDIKFSVFLFKHQKTAVYWR